MDDFEILKTYVNTLTNQLANLNNIVNNLNAQTNYLYTLYQQEGMTFDVAKLETKSAMAYMNIQTESLISQKNVVQGLIDTISSLVN